MPLGPPLNLRARAHRSEVDAMQIRVKKHQVVHMCYDGWIVCMWPLSFATS